MQCQVCTSDTKLVLDLGNSPPCDFLTKEESAEEIWYPLSLEWCPECDLVQLGALMSQYDLFTPKPGYHHIAALSSSFLKHLEELTAETVERFQLTPRDLVMEIGSNDGALLEIFAKRGVRVLGIDPTDVSQIAIAKGVPTVTEFFTEWQALRIKSMHGPSKVIMALNTFAHVSRLDSVVKGIESLLTPDGVFISENHYVLDLIEGLQYDFIYHEHSRYYSVKHLVYLFRKFGMDVFDVERVPTHSGSIRVFACKKGAYPISDVVAKLLKDEEDFGLSSLETYVDFAEKVKLHQEVFPNFLQEIHKSGKTIAGLTFPARAVTLLCSSKIGPETICCITELSKIKIGRVSPGTHIPVVDQEILFGPDAPDYGLVLSWHIAEELIPRFRARGFKGKFIIPLPVPKVID